MRATRLSQTLPYSINKRENTGITMKFLGWDELCGGTWENEETNTFKYQCCKVAIEETAFITVALAIIFLPRIELAVKLWLGFGALQSLVKMIHILFTEAAAENGYVCTCTLASVIWWATAVYLTFESYFSPKAPKWWWTPPVFAATKIVSYLLDCCYSGSQSRTDRRRSNPSEFQGPFWVFWEGVRGYMETIGEVAFIMLAVWIICLPQVEIVVKVWIGFGALDSLLIIIICLVKWTLKNTPYRDHPANVVAVFFWWLTALYLILESYFETEKCNRWWLLLVVLSRPVIIIGMAAMFILVWRVCMKKNEDDLRTDLLV